MALNTHSYLAKNIEFKIVYLFLFLGVCKGVVLAREEKRLYQPLAELRRSTENLIEKGKTAKRQGSETGILQI